MFGEKKTKLKYYFQVLFATLVWGAAYPFTKHISLLIPISLLIFLRALFASILFLVFIKPSVSKLMGFDLLMKILVMSILGVILQQYTQAYALTLTTSTNAGFLIAMTPIIVVFIEYLFGSKISKNKVFAFLLGFVGTLFVTYSTGRLNFSMPSTWGDIVFISSSFTWAFYVILTKRWFKNESQNEITALTMILSTIIMIPFFINLDFVNEFSKIDMLGWVSLGYLCFLSSFLGYMFWNNSVEKLGPIKTSYFIYDEPFAAMFSAYIISNETVSLVGLYGGFLILLGVYFIIKEKRIEYEKRTLF